MDSGVLPTARVRGGDAVREPIRSLPGDHEPVVTPPPGHPRFPLIDSLRGLAVLFILGAHGVTLSSVVPSAWYKGLFAHNQGLAVFFMVSGFVIYRPFVAHRVLGARHPGFSAYARRRFLRIVPPYWLALTALAIYPGLAGVFTGHWWVFYGLLQLFPVYDTTICAHAALGCGIPTAATLPGELGFYVVLPLYAIVMSAKPAAPKHWLRTEILVLSGLALASVAIRAWTAADWPFRAYLFYGTTGTFLWLAIGMAMAATSVALETRREKPFGLIELVARRPGLCWLAGVAIYIALAVVYPTPVLRALKPADGLAIALEFVALGAAGALFMLPAVFGERAGGVPRRILANRVLAWLGVVSYGMYLYHLPIQLKLRELGILEVLPRRPYLALVATSLGLTILCAAASYYVFERPILRLKERRRP